MTLCTPVSFCRFRFSSVLIWVVQFSPLQYSNILYSPGKSCLVTYGPICSAPEFLRHRKNKHPQSVPVCDKFTSEECTFGSKKCWFRHETDENDDVQDGKNDKKFENNETVQKIFKMMEKMTKRITDIEKQNMKS